MQNRTFLFSQIPFFNILILVIKEKKEKKIEVKDLERKFYRIYVKRKNLPMKLKFEEFKGEAMLFYCNDE